jgi:hypothetical protein
VDDSRSTVWRSVAGIAGCVLLAWFSVVREARVPLLGLVDLGFHELGHLLSLLLTDVVTAAMGSVAQVAVPLGLAAYFGFARSDAVGAGVCMAWAGTSARDVAVYVADAPFERLQLIGGEHDWAFILGPEHLDALESAATIASTIRVGGTILILTGLGCCAWGLVDRRWRARTAPTHRLREPDLGFGGRGGT